LLTLLDVHSFVADVLELAAESYVGLKRQYALHSRMRITAAKLPLLHAADVAYITSLWRRLRSGGTLNIKVTDGLRLAVKRRRRPLPPANRRRHQQS